MRVFTFITTFLLCLAAFGESKVGGSVDEARRKVDLWDFERLSGFFEFEAQEKKAEVDRLLGVDELKDKKRREELERAKALAEYQGKLRTDQRPRNDEDDPLYRAYLKEQIEIQKQNEREREKYITGREQLQNSGKVAPVSEAQELKIASDRERVDWRYRALYGGSSGKPLRSRSILSPPSRQTIPNDFGPMDPGGFVPPMTDDGGIPPFEGAEPEIFDEDIPPPPPPPEGFDEMIPPPPPGLDETDF